MFGRKVGQGKIGFQTLDVQEEKAHVISSATKVQPVDETSTVVEKTPRPKAMSLLRLLYVLRPFFWPSRGSDGALKNRFRAVSTWFAVGLSKATSIYAPFFLAGTCENK